jgi:hypothetical protein
MGVNLREARTAAYRFARQADLALKSGDVRDLRVAASMTLSLSVLLTSFRQTLKKELLDASRGHREGEG